MVWISIVYEIEGLPAFVAGILITSLTGLAMMSNLRYLSFKDFNLSSRVRFGNLLIIPLVLIVVSLNPPLVLFAMFFVYATSAPLIWLWRRSQLLLTGRKKGAA